MQVRAKAATFRAPRMRLSFCHFVMFCALALAGCQPSIGDPCTLATDCSSRGNRLCEPNLPGGYCTIFNCSPNKCPDEALCIAYGTALSTEPLCANPAAPRLERTFCMLACSSDSDCRTDSGYRCVDLAIESQNPWGAVVLDSDSRRKICTIPASGIPSSGELVDAGKRGTAVCSPPLDASFPPEPDGAPWPPIPDGATDAKPDGVAKDGGAPDARVDASVDAGSPPDAAPDVKDAQGGS